MDGRNLYYRYFGLSLMDWSGETPVPGRSSPPNSWPNPGPKWKWGKSSGRYKKGGRYRHWHNDPHHKPHWDEENKDGSGHENVYPPEPVPAPEPPPAVPDEGIVPDEAKRVAEGIAWGVVLYWVVSECSRAFPPRNLIPIP